MPTITSPRADVTSEDVTAALRVGLGPRHHVIPGMRMPQACIFAAQPDRDRDTILVSTGSSRLSNQIFRAQVTLTGARGRPSSGSAPAEPAPSSRSTGSASPGRSATSWQAPLASGNGPEEDCPTVPPAAVSREALDVGSAGLEKAEVALLAPGGELAQVECVSLAGQPGVAGQEPGQSHPLGIAEHRLGDGDHSGRGRGSSGHRGTSPIRLRPGRQGQLTAPATVIRLTIDRPPTITQGHQWPGEHHPEPSRSFRRTRLGAVRLSPLAGQCRTQIIPFGAA
jgi:hypothetical protein